MHNRKELIEEYTHTNMLVIEDFGMRRLPATAAEDLLEIFMQRYEKGAIIITSNRPVEEWSFKVTIKYFGALGETEQEDNN
jgi:DNA replication protein DnaC